MGACGNTTTKQNETNDESNGSNVSKKKKESVSVETENQIHKIFFNNSYSMKSVGVYAELRNTGDIPASVLDAEITLYDSDDNVIGVENASEGGGQLVSPYIIEPDASAYISLIVDYEDKYKDLDHVDIDYDADPADKTTFNKLDVDKVNVMNGEKYEDEDAPKDLPSSEMIDVTFKLKNSNDKDLDYMVGIGLYDKNDKFIGAMTDIDYIDVDYTVKSGASKSLEEKDFIPVKENEVDHAKVKAIGVESNGDEDF
ncbi:hypothetical protein RWE15_14245 [Virgibacillus halophilus]|uniref:DUF5067 domain-containing protein n=1 Tax=Tigheibacillus halophilus TaxID=361280 RepID=A0ABU5C9P5_9BACI|nr:hypothetical protein [Virgibacillus halophilus]